MHIDKAARVSIESVQKILKQMDNSIKNLETDLKNSSRTNQDPDDGFEEAMGTFSTEARAQYSILNAMGSKMESLYTDLAEYFVFDKQKYTLEEFFGDIKLFKDQFKQVGRINSIVFKVSYFLPISIQNIIIFTSSFN
jgi:hypothetical protein